MKDIYNFVLKTLDDGKEITAVFSDISMIDISLIDCGLKYFYVNHTLRLLEEIFYFCLKAILNS